MCGVLPDIIGKDSGGRPVSFDATASGGDMFLKVEGARSGAFKGESQDPSHRDEIDVVSWSWGMQGNASATVTTGGRGGGANQVSARELEVLKRVDGATSALLSALRNNEPLKATLTVRKAGGSSPVEYLKVILEKARVRSVDLESGAGGEGVVERIRLSFQRITIEYRSQSAKGSGSGVSGFSMELDQA